MPMSEPDKIQRNDNRQEERFTGEFVKKYIQYLKYLLRHKYYVGIECLRRGLFIQAFTHDMSKFLPDELIPYANYFYSDGNTIKKGRDDTGYYKPTDTGDAAFDFAWLLHQKRNKHHWQWWILPEDSGGMKVLEIPSKYIVEMLCDWIGAGKAQGHFSPKEDPLFETRRWYAKNGNKMQLGNRTRAVIEMLLSI